MHNPGDEARAERRDDLNDGGETIVARGVASC